MEAVWIPKTNFYVKLDELRLQEILDEVIVSIVGYNPERVWTLGNVCRGIKYLENNEVAINIQICNPMWTDVELKDGSTINALGVMDYINTQDFDLAMYYFQIAEFPERLISQVEYDVLIPLVL